MGRWRIGIIGCGWAGEQHARAVRALVERVELCAVADVDAALAQARARDWQVPLWTDDYRELLTRERLDAVSICLPHDLHASVAVEAAGAGLHVLVEKPLATTLAEADAMVAAAEAAGVQLMVAENMRFNPLYIHAADLIRSGALGDVFLVRIAREHEMHDYLRQRPWFLEQRWAGIMYSGGIHDFELLRMLAGEIEHVYGLRGRQVLSGMAGDDTSVALVGLCSGASAVIVESFSLKTPKPGVHGSVHGSRASLWFGEGRLALYAAPQDGRPDLVEEIVPRPRDTFEAEIAHFFECLEQGTEPITSAREEREPLVAVVATYESIKRGERQYLAELREE
jgi:UDP-N-acetyl-2-amino-2-deoxyglucuronate dehydrogenase